MGKRKIGPKRRWKNNKKPKENVWRPKEEVVRESPLFEGYYKLQKIVPEGEWDAFIECLVIAGWAAVTGRRVISPRRSALTRRTPTTRSSNRISRRNTTSRAPWSTRDSRFPASTPSSGTRTRGAWQVACAFSVHHRSMCTARSCGRSRPSRSCTST